MRLATTLSALVFFCSLLLAGSADAYENEVNSLSQEIAGKISKGPNKIAVVDFTDLNGGVTALGRFLAEEFSVNLANSESGFQLIDRTHLASIIREHKLSKTGLIDPATARKLGQITGAGALLTGSLTAFGDSVRVTVKVLDVETATIIASASGNIPKTEAIRELLALDVQGTGNLTRKSREPSTSNVTPPPASSQISQTVETNDYTFKLKQCKAIGDRIQCDMIIVNNGEARNLYLTPDTRFFDELGKEYGAAGAELGKEKKVFRNRISPVRNHVLPGIPVRAELSFPSILDGAKTMTVLDIDCNKFNVQFKNVAVQ